METEELDQVVQNDDVSQDVTQENEPAAEIGEPATDSGTESLPDYTPNYDYKVRGDTDTETRQIDDWLRSTITDKASEDRAREFTERAYGLDSVKLDRQKLRDENTNLQERAGNFDTVSRDLQNVGKYVQNGDFGNFFSSMNIKEEDVYKWVLEKARVQEMAQTDPAGYDNYMRNTNVQNQNYQLQQQNDMLMQQQQNHESTQIHNEMDHGMNDPSTVGAAQQFDARMGAGAFRQEVISRGQAHFARTGFDKRPTEIINEVVSMLGYGQRQDQPTLTTTHTQPTSRRAIETMPNVSGRGTSPIKKKPSSIADLRKMGANL